jgi:group I intron endonuclease
MIYANFHELEVRSKIASDLNHKSGIYCFRHNSSGKMYIGSSVNLNRRFYAHYSNNPSNVKLQAAFSKYGHSEFTYYILEFVDLNGLSDSQAKMFLHLTEQSYLDLLNPQYNLSPSAESPLGYKFPLETLIKLKAARDERKELTGIYYHSEDSLQRVRDGQAKRDQVQEENKRRTPIFIFNEAGILDRWYRGLRLMAQHERSSVNTIKNCLEKGKLYRKKWLLFSKYNFIIF